MESENQLSAGNISGYPPQENRRDISIDMMSAVPTETLKDKEELIVSTVYPKPLTEHTLSNIRESMSSEIINGMSVVAARAFDVETIQKSNIPIQSVDYPVYTGLKEITQAYSERIKKNGLSPNEFVKTVTDIAGEFLMHTNEKKGQIETNSLLETMISKKQFGLLRLDSAQALIDIPSTVRILKDIKNSVKGKSFYSAIEIKPSKDLPDLMSNINAYEDLKNILSKENLPLLLSLDIRAIAPFFENPAILAQMNEDQKQQFWEESENRRIQFIDNILTNSPKDIGLIELSGTNYYGKMDHSSPFTDKPAMTTVDLVQRKEKNNTTWGLPSNKLGFVIETHPTILKQLTDQLVENGKILL